jgi:hypothetical protein
MLFVYNDAGFPDLTATSGKCCTVREMKNLGRSRITLFLLDYVGNCKYSSLAVAFTSGLSIETQMSLKSSLCHRETQFAVHRSSFIAMR